MPFVLDDEEHPGPPVLEADSGLSYPSTPTEVAKWVYSYPLRTVEAICNLADYGNRKWDFRLVDDLDLYPLFTTFTLREKAFRGKDETWHNQMAVFTAPPWMISLEDFREFVNVPMIRDFKTGASLLEKYGDACQPTALEALWVMVSIFCF